MHLLVFTHILWRDIRTVGRGGLVSLSGMDLAYSLVSTLLKMVLEF
jgi:hypothetical protein